MTSDGPIITPSKEYRCCYVSPGTGHEVYFPCASKEKADELAAYVRTLRDVNHESIHIDWRYSASEWFTEPSHEQEREIADAAVKVDA